MTLGVLIALFALGGAGYAAWPHLRLQAEIGTAFGARTACTCHFIGRRPLGDCRKDFEDGMALVSIEEDHEARVVRASVPLIARSRARYREGWGCLLEPYAG